MPSEFVETCQAAIDAWGENSQEDMCIEECAELIKAILDQRRGRCGKAKVAEEAADVLIMAAQMRMMVGEKLVDDWIGIKLRRLRERIDQVNGTEQS